MTGFRAPAIGVVVMTVLVAGAAVVRGAAGPPSGVQSQDPSALHALRFELVADSDLLTERASTGGITWVDFDGDGDDDVFVTNGYDVSRSPAVPQANRLYENVNGSLRALQNPISEDPGFSSGSAWADFDNDGAIDLYVPNQRNQDNFLYRNRGEAGFELLRDAPPSRGGGLSFAATWGDVDGDGFVDLFVANGGLSGPDRDALYMNRGGRAFERVAAGPIVEGEGQSGGGTFVDYDLDGDLDLFVPGDPTRMYRNDGSGSFTVDTGPLFVNEPSASDLSVSGAWADVDNDGDLDLFQTFAGGDSRRFYRNEGRGRFVRADLGDATRERSAAFHALWVDLDNDGSMDLVVANWGAPPDVYLNRDGVALDRVRLGAPEERAWYASMVAASDYDLDGDIDLVVGNWPSEPGEGEANLLYRNLGPSGNWIGLRLEGTVSNRSAIGARIQVTVDDGTERRVLLRDVRSQDGWRSQSSLETLVGLGTAERAEGVRVRWPSGIVQEIGPIPAGERRRIVEPASSASSDARPDNAALHVAVEDVLAELQVPGGAVGVVRGDPARADATLQREPSRHTITVDARTRPGTLLVRGTSTFAAAESGGETFVEFRLMASAGGLEVEAADPESEDATIHVERRGTMGDGLGRTTTWRVRTDGNRQHDTVALRYRYELSGTDRIFHVSERLAFASGLNLPWHPQAGSSDGVGRLRLVTPPEWDAVASGRRVHPAPETPGEFLFDFSRPATWSFAIGEWSVVEDTSGGTPVRVHLATPRRNARQYASRTARILDILEREFGPYPYGEFAVVEVPSTTANAAGFGGVSLEGWMIAIPPAMGEELSPCFFGHEIAHQWWGNLVKSTPGAVGNGIMDEGLANYAGHLAVAELNGAPAASAYRRFGCPVLGWPPSALGYLAQVAAGEDRRLDRLPGSRVGQWLMDNKMYLVWVELGRVLGPDRIRAGFHEIVRRHGRDRVSWDEVLDALAAGAGEPRAELESFFAQWHGRTGAPDLTTDWTPAAGGIDVKVTQTDPPYSLRVPLRIHGPRGASLDVEVNVDGLESVHHLPVPFPVWAVDVDPDYTFLHWTEELRAAAAPLGHYIRGLYQDTDLESALRSFDRGMELLPEPDLHSACLLLEYGRGRVYQRHSDWPRAQHHFTAALRCPSRRPDFLPTVYLRLAEVAREVRDRPAFDRAVRDAVSADVSAGGVTSAGAAARELRYPDP